MSEKVLGFKEKDAKLCKSRTANKEFFYDVYKKDIVPVVSLEWLEKEIERLKKKSTGGLNSEYARAWDDGYGSAMRDIISITKGEVAKKQAGEK